MVYGGDDVKGVADAGTKHFLDDAQNYEEDPCLSTKNLAAPQLTVKALIAGVVAGSFGCFLAIYNGLKTGIVPSLNIISALLGYFFCKFLVMFIPEGIFTPQENVVIQTTAVACLQVGSSTGFSSGLLAMGKNAALQTPHNPSYIDLTYPVCLAFCFSAAFFGFFIAFPMRKYCIIDRKFQFPSGTATAEVIRTMHADGESAWTGFKMLCRWTGVTFIQQFVTWFWEGLSQTPLLGLTKWMDLTMDWDLSSWAIGMILPNAINLSILLGGVIAQGIVNPWIINNVACPQKTNSTGTEPLPDGCWYIAKADPTYADSYLEARAYYFYPAVAMIIFDGFYSIAKLIHTILKDFCQKVEDLPAGQQADEESNPNASRLQNKLNDIFLSSSFPLPMLLGGYASTAMLSVFLVNRFFGVSWYEVLIAVTLTPVFAVGIIVGVGMTDWDVSANFGKLMMFPFGAMARGSGSLTAPLAACMLTISGCGAAAGLMQDFKTGYLLGSSPRKMFFAQIVGAVSGCFIAPAIFQVFNSAYVLPGDPDKQALGGIYGTLYRMLANVFTEGGISSLPKYTPQFMLVAAILGLALNISKDLLSAKFAQYIPNPMAISIGLMMGPGVGLNFAIGGLAISLWRHLRSEECDKFSVIVASGCLAGGGLGQVFQIALNAVGVQTVNWPVWNA